MGDEVAAKSTPVTCPLLTDTLRLPGENVKPLLEGVTTYDPFARPTKLKAPVASAVAFAVAVPPRVTAVAAPAAAGVMAPAIE